MYRTAQTLNEKSIKFCVTNQRLGKGGRGNEPNRRITALNVELVCVSSLSLS